jgi:hypothetical protein
MEYFGITERIATRKASNGLLPVPAFRLTGTRKGPLYVMQSDLEAHVQLQYEKAQKLNAQMRAAGLV